MNKIEFCRTCIFLKWPVPPHCVLQELTNRSSQSLTGLVPTWVARSLKCSIDNRDSHSNFINIIVEFFSWNWFWKFHKSEDKSTLFGLIKLIKLIWFFTWFQTIGRLINYQINFKLQIVQLWMIPKFLIFKFTTLKRRLYILNLPSIKLFVFQFDVSYEIQFTVKIKFNQCLKFWNKRKFS